MPQGKCWRYTGGTSLNEVLQIDLKDVKTYCGTSFYGRGDAYYKQGRVKHLKISADDLQVSADVRGTQDYLVDVYFLDGFIDYGVCECRAYQDYDNCKHIAAVLIAYVYRQKSSLMGPQATGFWPEVSTARNSSPGPARLPVPEPPDVRKLQRLRQILSPTFEATPSVTLQTQFIVHLVPQGGYGTGYGFGIEMKVGVDRLYVVPKIRTFLESVRSRRPQLFTKKFTFDPSLQRFSPADQAIVDVLSLTLSLEGSYDTHYGYGYRYSYNGERALYIPPVMWDRLLPLLPDTDAVWVSTSPFVVSESEISMSFSLTAEPGTYSLRFDRDSGLMLMSDYGCAIKGEVLYRMDSARAEKIKALHALGEGVGSEVEVSIPDSQLDDVMERMVPAMEEVGAVTIAPEIQERVSRQPLETRLYLDWDGETLEARLEYHYGHSVFEPSRVESRTPQGGVIVLRDRSAEERVLQELLRAGFEGENPLALREPDDIYAFWEDKLPELSDQVAVFVTSAIDPVTVPKAPRLRADIVSETNWLSVDFDLGDVDPAEVQAVLRSLKEKRRYHRLKDGSLLGLEDASLGAMGDLLSSLDVDIRRVKKGQVVLPLLDAVPLMDQGIPGAGVHLGQALRQWFDTLRNPDNLEAPIPDSVEATLRPYQVSGYQWLHMLGTLHLGGILADDMGLGKTIQTITWLAAERQHAAFAAPALVVVPTSLIYNWQQELRQFAPTLTTRVVAGAVTERQSLLEDWSGVDVLITSYPLLRRDLDVYRDTVFHAVIFDEAQAVKNHNTQTAQAAAAIQSAHRLALTGTPVENSLDDLWSIFHIIMPALLGSRERFLRLTPEQVARRVRPFILRRLKSEVLTELPDKIETLQTTPLTDQQKTVYLAYLEKIQADTVADLKLESFQKSRMKVLAGLTRLRQICCHPALFLENYQGTSAKLELLLELVEEAVGAGKRILIFSQFTSMLSLIREAFAERGWDPFYLDGSTPSQERMALVQRFNAGERALFLISLKAGGTGLNLTGADTVILYDLWWNPAVEQQAIDRAHRIGQKHVVQVIRLVAQGTVEEKIYALQQKKRDLIDQVVDAGAEGISALTEADVREILGIGV